MLHKNQGLNIILYKEIEQEQRKIEKIKEDNEKEGREDQLLMNALYQYENKIGTLNNKKIMFSITKNFNILFMI